MTLTSLQPDPAWDPEAYEPTVDAFAELAADDDAEIHVWGGDWCGDCRAELPELGAVLEAAAFPDDRLHVHPVDREKGGDLVDEYDVALVPTVVVERGDEELARFVESEPLPAPVTLAEELRETGAVA
jgi:thiol-disulfide isomerase/thioredoxin